MQQLTSRLWGKCVPSGDIDVQSIHAEEGVASYVTKQLPGLDTVGIRWFSIM